MRDGENAEPGLVKTVVFKLENVRVENGRVLGSNATLATNHHR